MTNGKIVFLPFTRYYLPIVFGCKSDQPLSIISAPAIRDDIRSYFSRYEYKNVVNTELNKTDSFVIISTHGDFEQFKWAYDYLNQNNICRDRIRLAINKEEQKMYAQLLPEIQDYEMIKSSIEDQNERSFSLSKMDCEVTAIISISGDNNKDNVTMSLNNHFVDNDYQVVSCYSNNAYKVLGNPTIDYDWLLSLGADNSIFRLNSFITNICKKRKPNKVLFSVPGDLLKYNSRIINSAGIYSFMLGRSVKINKAICCLPADIYSQRYLELLSNRINHILNCEETLFHMSDHYVSSNMSNLYRSIESIVINKDVYQSIKDKTNRKNDLIYNFTDDQDIIRAFSS